MGSPVLQGADALHPAEALGKVAQGGKTQNLGDEGQGVVRLPEEKAALLNAAGDQVVDGGHAELPAEGVGQVILVQVGQLGQLVQVQVLLEVIVDVPPDQVALPAGPGAGGLS